MNDNIKNFASKVGFRVTPSGIIRAPQSRFAPSDQLQTPIEEYTKLVVQHCTQILFESNALPPTPCMELARKIENSFGLLNDSRQCELEFKPHLYTDTIPK